MHSNIQKPLQKKEGDAIQTVALRPRKAQITAKLAGLLACVASMALFPRFCVVFALLTPLFACPLMGLKQQWAAFAAILAPGVITLIMGMDALYALSLALICGLPVAATLYMKSEQRTASAVAILYHIGAIAAALVVVALFAGRMLGGTVSAGLTNAIVGPLAASPSVGVTLYRLAAAGVIGVPTAYQNADVLRFAIDPVLIRQLMLSLRLTLDVTFTQLMPTLFVQLSIILGLFTTLRVQRFQDARLLVSPKTSGEEEGRVHIAVPPGFSLLQLPPVLRWPLIFMGIASVVLISQEGSFYQLLGVLLYTTFTCSFELVGAAVMVCLLMARNHEHAPLYGILAALVFVVFPVALFLVGILDPLLHFRSKTLFQQEEE